MSALRRRISLSGEDGIGLVELVVAVTAATAVLLGIFTVANGTLRGSVRVQQRVDATQRARPVMTRILDELHSACVSPGVAPVLAGSSDDSISFIHAAGRDVVPGSSASFPLTQRVIALSGTTLTETVYLATTTSAPYSFSSTPEPNTPMQLLTGVARGSVGGTSGVPVFRYFAYDTSGVISSTPLPTPLSVDDAEQTVQVDIAFAVSPSKTRIVEPNTALTVSDSVLFRFSPAAEDASQSQLPCT